MKKYFSIVIILIVYLSSANIQSQEPDKQSVLNEGRTLFRIEKANWHGTDYFFEHFKDKSDSIRGCFSYIDSSNSTVVNVFMGRKDPYHILSRFYFDSIPQKTPKLIDFKNTVPNELEKILIAIRENCIKQVVKNEDDFFSFYKNVNFNFIPIIYNSTRKVILLSASTDNETAYIGNDYALYYNENNEMSSKERIHNSLIALPFRSKDKDNKLEMAIHSHILSDLITATDICTLILYKNYFEWKSHYVISPKYVSIFNLKDENLIIMDRSKFDEIMNK